MKSGSTERPLSPEAIALGRAIRTARLSQAAAARHAGVSPAQLRQWVIGSRTMPPRYAERLGKYLNCDPGAISLAYAELRASSQVIGHAGGGDPERMPKSVTQLENDVEALRFGIASLVAVMVSHRPAEASDVADAIRRSVPAQHRDGGFLSELLLTLDKSVAAK